MKSRFLDTRKKARHEGWAKTVLLSLLALVAATANTAHAQTCNPILYGTAYFQEDPDNDPRYRPAYLYAIDPVTAKQIGTRKAIGFNRISAMDVEPGSDKIYAAAEEPGTYTPVLIEIDRITGLGKKKGNMNVRQIDGRNEPIAGMSIRSDKKIFAFGADGGVYEVNKKDGKTTLLGGGPDDSLVGNAIAFSPDDVLYHSGSDGDLAAFFNTVDQTNGVLTPNQNLRMDPIYADDVFAPITAMDYGPETGIYYAIVKNGKSSSEVFLAELVDLGKVGEFNVYVTGIGYTADDLGGLAYYCESLHVDKSADVTSYDAVDDVISYTYVVTNTGNHNRNLTNVTLTDPLSGLSTLNCTPAQPATLAPLASMTCTATYSIIQDDLDAGSVVNTATADSDQTVVPVDDTVTVNGPAAVPSLSIDKSTTTLAYTAVSDTISYSYLLTNSGNVTLYQPFSVADDKATVTCPAAPASLAPTQSITCLATYTITQTDIDNGSVTNIASATGRTAPAGKGGGDPVSSGTDSVTVNG
ncbi:hypothetical protein ACFL3I_12815, partial [Pseudomonadota bacterium]